MSIISELIRLVKRHAQETDSLSEQIEYRRTRANDGYSQKELARLERDLAKAEEKLNDVYNDSGWGHD